MAADKPALAQSTTTAAGGSVSTYNQTTLKLDYSKILTLDYDNEVPFTAFLGTVPAEKAVNSKFRFFVGRRIPRSTTVGTGQAAGSAASSVSLPVATGTGKYFSIGDIIYLPSTTVTGIYTNVAKVTAVSTDTLTIYPIDIATGTSAIGATTTADPVYRVSAGVKEGSEGRNAIQTVPTEYYNYVQTFEDYGRVNDQVELSDTWIQEKEVARVTREKRFEHIQNLEGASLFGLKGSDITVSGGQENPAYYMDGLFNIIKTNTYNWGSAMSQAGLYNFMAQVHKPAHTMGNVRYVFASMGAMNAFNKLFTSALRIQPAEGEMAWRVNFTQITYLGFTWKFFLCPTISYFYDNAAVVFAPQQVGKKTLIPTEFRPNVQIPKANYREFGWRTAFGIKLAMEEASGIIYSA